MVGAAGVVTGVVGGTAAVDVVGALGTVGEVNVLALGLFPPFSARAAAAATASVCNVVGDLLRSCFLVGVPTFISGDRSSRDVFLLSRVGEVLVLIVSIAVVLGAFWKRSLSESILIDCLDPAPPFLLRFLIYLIFLTLVLVPRYQQIPSYQGRKVPLYTVSGSVNRPILTLQ